MLTQTRSVVNRMRATDARLARLEVLARGPDTHARPIDHVFLDVYRLSDQERADAIEAAYAASAEVAASVDRLVIVIDSVGKAPDGTLERCYNLRTEVGNDTTRATERRPGCQET